MSGRRTLLIAAILLVAGAAVFFVVPEIARRRAIADAARRGVTLTIGKARLTGSGVRFFELEAHLDKVPGAVAKAAEARVELSGLSPDGVELSGLEVSIPDLLAAAPQLEAMRAAHAETDLRRIAFKSALVHLARIAGPSTSLEVEGASAEIAPEETHLRADKVAGTLGVSPFGPWKAAADRTREGGGAWSARIMMDPSKPDVAQIEIHRAGNATQLDIKTERAHVRSLGLPFSAFGLTADDDPEIDVDASAMSEDGQPRQSSGALLFQTWGVQLGAFPAAVDVKLGGKWKGQGENVAVHDGVVQVGPFGGNLRGSVRAGLAPRLDFAFDSEPIPCIAGTLVFDATNPAENRLTLKPNAGCALTLR